MFVDVRGSVPIAERVAPARFSHFMQLAPQPRAPHSRTGRLSARNTQKERIGVPYAIGLQAIRCGNACQVRSLVALSCRIVARTLILGLSRISDEAIYHALDTNVTMVALVREKLVSEGLDAVLMRKKRDTPPIEPIFDGKRQAQLIALACSKPPAGRARWTIRLLAEQVVERKIVESAHFNTVARALKKTTSNRTSRNTGSSHRKPTPGS
jgi:hypothetical protein